MSRVRWIKVAEQWYYSISEELYSDIMKADSMKLAEYLIHPTPVIRAVAEKIIRSRKNT